MKYISIIFFIVIPDLGFGKQVGQSTQARVIGIMTLPEVFGNYPCEDFEIIDVPIFDSPSFETQIGRIYVATPWVLHSVGGCAGLEVKVETFDSDIKESDLPALEFQYEQLGAIVINRNESWYQIKLNENSGWIYIKDDKRYFPVEKLLKQSMSFLYGDDIKIYSEPGNSDVIWAAVDTIQNLPIEVFDSKILPDRVWLQVELHTENYCTGKITGAPSLRGWVPLHKADGSLSAWFWSRGC